MMNATFEEAKRKSCALHVRVVGWAEKRSTQEDSKNLRTKIGASNIPFASTRRVVRDESRSDTLIIHVINMKK